MPKGTAAEIALLLLLLLATNVGADKAERRAPKPLLPSPRAALEPSRGLAAGSAPPPARRHESPQGTPDGAQNLISIVMGAGILVGSLSLKLPQIVKVLAARSVDGLSLAACYAEVPMYSSFAIYHARLRYPWDTYGENVAITAQNLVIIAIFWALKPQGLTHMAAVMALGVGLHIGLWLLPMRLQPVVAQAQPLAMLAGYGPQVMLNARKGCTGQLSALTCLMRFCGCLVRLVTTVTRVGGDPWLLAAYSVSAVGTAALIAQVALLPSECAHS